MDKLKLSKISSLIAVVITVSLVFSFSLAPKKTEAWVGVADVNVDSASNILSFATEMWNAFMEYEGWWKEWILDPIAYVVAQQLLSDITNSTVEWINNGFDGSPLYDVNFADSIKTGLNEASGILIDKLGGEGLCEDLAPNLKLTFGYTDSYKIKMKCTINDIVDNVTDFYDDFSSGGWKGWVTLTVQPQNNPYGAYITSAARYQELRAEKAKEVENEIQSGNGFKSFKKCSEYSDDIDGNPTTTCKKWSIETPGKTIEARLTTATGVDFASLNAADEMSEIIGALLQAAMTAIFEEGSSSTEGSGGGGLKNADLTQDVTPASIQQDVADLKIDLQIYYDYFTKTSEALPNGLHYEIRQTSLSEAIYQENYWRLAQYCKNDCTMEGTGIEATKYMKEIISAGEDEVKAEKLAKVTKIQENVNAAKGLYSDGFTDDNGNAYEGVYSTTYSAKKWSNVTTKILNAWESKLTDLKAIQRGDLSRLKMIKQGKSDAKDAYKDQCLDIDTMDAVLCVLSPFCGTCDILGFSMCDTLCPCLKMKKDGKCDTGENYENCVSDLGGVKCNRGDTCEKPDGTPGKMRPTAKETFCCVDGGVCVQTGSDFNYSETPTPINEGEEPEVPNQCAEATKTCADTLPCCDTANYECGHYCNKTNYCYPKGTPDLLPPSDLSGCTQCAAEMETCSQDIECCDSSANVCGHIINASGNDYCYPRTTANVTPAGSTGVSSCGVIPSATWNKTTNPECSISIAGYDVDGACPTRQCDRCNAISRQSTCLICLGRNVPSCR